MSGEITAAAFLKRLKPDSAGKDRSDTARLDARCFVELRKSTIEHVIGADGYAQIISSFAEYSRAPFLSSHGVHDF
jgi:hypothetical protein